MVFDEPGFLLIRGSLENFDQRVYLFFINHGTLDRTATGLGDAANLHAAWEY